MKTNDCVAFAMLIIYFIGGCVSAALFLRKKLRVNAAVKLKDIGGATIFFGLWPIPFGMWFHETLLANKDLVVYRRKIPERKLKVISETLPTVYKLGGWMQD